MTTTTTSPTGHGGLARGGAADLALRSIQIMVDGSPDDFVDVVHPDAINREARDEPPQCRGRGPEAFYATALWLRATFSEMAFDVHEVVVDGDLVVVHTTMSGRQTGVATIYDHTGRVERAMPATGRRFAASHTHWLRLRDALVVEHWANRDDLGTATQLGWVPPTPLFLVRGDRYRRCPAHRTDRQGAVVRILFRSLPAYGHLYPMMPLALAARARGHDVVFSCAGDFVDRLRALGLAVHAAGVTIEEARLERFGPNPPPTVVDGETDWDVIGDLFHQCAVRTIDDLMDQMPAIAPDLVVYEQLDIGAAVVAEAASVPAVCHAVLRSLTPTVHQRLYGSRPHALLDALGLPGTLDIGRGGALLDNYPPSLQLRSALANPHRLAVRPVPWSEPSLPLPLLAAQRRRRPLVYVTFGTVRGYPSPLRTVIDGLAALDVDVLVATGTLDAGEVRLLPARVHLEPFVDQAALLRRVDLIVHHGGCGTTTGAWANAVPQLVLPQGADQYINSAVVDASGTGVDLRQPTADLVAESARRMLDDQAYVRAARRVRNEIAAMPHPAEVVDKVLGYADSVSASGRRW